MKDSKNKQTLKFDTNNHHDVLTIGSPTPLYKLLLHIKIKEPLKESQSIIFTFNPMKDDVKSIVSTCNLKKSSNGGYFIVGKTNEIIEDVIMIIEAEANVYNPIELDIEVFEIDKKERNNY